MDRLSRIPEIAGSRELRGCWPELQPGIRRSKVEMQDKASLLPESELGLIRAGLAEATEAQRQRCFSKKPWAAGSQPLNRWAEVTCACANRKLPGCGGGQAKEHVGAYQRGNSAAEE